MAARSQSAVTAGVRSGPLPRALEVTLSAALAILTVPILLLSVVGSAISLRAWPFFSHERVGRDGVPFKFVKIRTLPTTVPAYADKFQLDHESIPAFCRLLRACHVDELPQLYLVLFGRMSLVGPRPEMPWLHEGLPGDFARERTMVRPGCTGLWQISDSCAGLIGSAPEYDLFYLAHRSLRLDAWVLYRTVLKVLGFARAVSLADVPAWAIPSGMTVVVDVSAAPASARYG